MSDRSAYYHHGPGDALGALVGAGEIHDKPGVCTARRLDDYALVFVIAGGGWFSHGGGPAQPVTAGDVLLLFPGIIHSYGPHAGQQWSEYWMMFRGALFDALHAHGALDPQHPILHAGLHPRLLTTCSDLIAARVAAASRVRSPALAHAEEADLAAQTVLLLTRLRQRSLADQAPSPPWLEAACAALAVDLHLPADLRRIARDCGVGYDWFRKMFSEALGLPPARYRLLRRIDRAKALLTAGETVAQTAEQLGFCDIYFFTRQFKAVTGTTPARFRGSAVQRR